MPPFSRFEPVEPQVLDSYSLERRNGISQHFTHPSDLPIESLRQCDRETAICLFLDFAGNGHWAVGELHARLHTTQEFVRDVRRDGDDVFFLVSSGGSQEAVGQVSVVREQKKTGGHLVEPAYRIDSFGESHKINDIIRVALLRGGGDIERLVQKNVYLLLFKSDGFAVHSDDLAGMNAVADLRDFPVDCNLSKLDIFVGFAPRAEAAGTQVAVEPDSIGVRELVIIHGEYPPLGARILCIYLTA